MLWVGLILAWYGWCLSRVAWTAVHATSHEGDADCILLLGRRSPKGEVHPHFWARINRARVILLGNQNLRWVLSGGAPAGEPTEAKLARDHLAFPDTAQVEMEEASNSTWRNMRNSRRLLQSRGVEPGRVAIISNRYHLARCQAMARSFGFSTVLCAAEDQWAPSPAACVHLCREAGYLMVWPVAGAALRLMPRF